MAQEEDKLIHLGLPLRSVAVARVKLQLQKLDFVFFRFPPKKNLDRKTATVATATIGQMHFFHRVSPEGSF
jgi:hypothetical protein